MEHRYNSRTPVSLDVLLYYQGLPVSICRARDIGLGGMSVNANKVAVLPKNAAVEVLILHREPDKRTRLSAYVVYKSGQGMGLLFSRLNQRAANTVRALIGDTSAASAGLRLASNI